MKSLRDACFVDRDTIDIRRYTTKTLLMVGQVGCKGNIVLSVEKLLEITGDGDDPPIQTETYSYNAFIRNGHNILRYDNQHDWPAHPDRHHKHTFNFETGDELEGSPAWIGAERWPTLGEVLRELMTWHEENYDRLKEPESYAVPDQHTPRLLIGFDSPE